MDYFENVSIIKKANVYFDGKVTSRTVLFTDGSKKTLGIMFPGEYSFTTAAAELMEILAGEITVLLPGQSQWHTYKAGDSFSVPADSKFDLQLQTMVDYCCSYEEK
ncbi:MAG TPA: pyrimidine/purine nucleoside phosphorylase [Negativicutes bacterium]|jgi:hypothetical protein